MGLDPKVVTDQIDAILAPWEEAASRSQYSDCSDLPEDKISEFLTLLHAAIDRLAPPGSTYRENADATVERHGPVHPYNLRVLAGILRALRVDYEAGYLQTIHELIHADVFADFLQMAGHLLAESYKDPAAVMAEGVLEEQLRKLCLKNGLATDSRGRAKKADTLNADLGRARAYSNLDQKSVTAWLDLRNKAAHGRYNEYTTDQVALMLQGIQDFVGRHPA